MSDEVHETVRLPYTQPYPWVMVPHDITSDPSSKVQTLYNISTKQEYITKINDISGAVVCASYCGWMVLINMKKFECFLLNMTSLEKIMLPKFSSKKKISRLSCFGLQPNHTDYFVMTGPPTVSSCILGLFSTVQYCLNTGKPYLKALIWRPGQQGWVKLRYNLHKLSHLAVCNQKIYCVVDSKQLGVCDIVKNELTVRVLGPGRPKKSRKKHERGCPTYLVGVEDEIFCVQIFKEMWTGINVFIDVYKFDEKNAIWIMVKDINDSVFFLNGPHSFSCSTTTNSDIQKNSIYFFQNDILHTFNMETERISYRCIPQRTPQEKPIWNLKLRSQFVMVQDD